MLDKIVTAMDGIYEQMAQLKAADTRGDVYEYLMSKIATVGVNGQFRLPAYHSHDGGSDGAQSR